jgi:hypothetical protein
MTTQWARRADVIWSFGVLHGQYTFNLFFFSHADIFLLYALMGQEVDDREDGVLAGIGRNWWGLSGM